jgi:hypothetical protein
MGVVVPRKNKTSVVWRAARKRQAAARWRRIKKDPFMLMKTRAVRKESKRRRKSGRRVAYARLVWAELNSIDRMIYQYKMNHPCPCGNADPRGLDLHHLDPETKMFNVGDRRGWSVGDVVEEIAKCVVLCAYCHRLIETESWVPPTAEEIWQRVSGVTQVLWIWGLCCQMDICVFDSITTGGIFLGPCEYGCDMDFRICK